MAMFRRPRPTGGRHPPPLAPTVSTFKPRSEWSNAGSSIFLYVNLPGFYRDQIQIKSDEKTRTIQIQGQRPLSTQTRARFNESYRVPETCDMRNIKTSFLHGLLTIELPIVDLSEKRVQDQAKVAWKPDQEEGRARGYNGGVGSKQPTRDDEKLVEGAVQAKEEDDRLSEDKRVAAIGQGKSEQRIKEDKGRMSVADGSLERKKPVEEEKPVKKKEAVAERGWQASGQIEKEGESKMLEGDSSSGRKKQEEEDESVGDVASQEKEAAATNRVKSEQKMKEREERRSEIDGTLGSKQPKQEEKLDEEKAGKEQIRDQAKQKKPGEVELGRDVAEERRDETVNVKLGLQKDEELRKPDSEDPTKREPEGESNTKKTMESETFHDATSEVVKDQGEVNGNKKILSDAEDLRKNLLQRKDEEQLQKHGMPLANVGVAALVIMGFGAYLFLPFFKLFH